MLRKLLIVLALIAAVAVNAKKHQDAYVTNNDTFINAPPDDTNTDEYASQMWLTPPTTNTTGCSCVRSGLYLFGYEQIVTDNAGSACIGGCGGSDFVFHESGSFIQSIFVWFGCGVPNNGVRAIQITLKNGRAQTFGRPCGNPISYTFQAGETLTGNVVLGGNGIGTRLGYISFTTSRGNTFKAGTLRTPYVTPADSRFLVGVFGGSGTDIDRMGFIFSKRIVNSQLESVTYPTLGTYTSGLSPSLLKEDIQCNQSPVDQSRSTKFTMTDGIDHCWTSELSMSLEFSFSVTAGVPNVASTNAGFKWTVGAKATYQKCEKTTRAVENTYNLVIPAQSRCSVTITQFDSKINNLPFQGVLRLYFQDGTSSAFNTGGTFAGAYISRSLQNIQCEKLGTNEKCPAQEDDDDDDDASDDDDDDDDDNSDNASATAIVNDDDNDDDDASVTFEEVKKTSEFHQESELPRNNFVGGEEEKVQDDDDDDDDN